MAPLASLRDSSFLAVLLGSVCLALLVPSCMGQASTAAARPGLTSAPGKLDVPVPAGKHHVPVPEGKHHVPVPHGKHHAPVPHGKHHVPVPHGKHHVPVPAGKHSPPPPAGSHQKPPPSGNHHKHEDVEFAHLMHFLNTAGFSQFRHTLAYYSVDKVILHQLRSGKAVTILAPSNGALEGFKPQCRHHFRGVVLNHILPIYLDRPKLLRTPNNTPLHTLGSDGLVKTRGWFRTNFYIIKNGMKKVQVKVLKADAFAGKQVVVHRVDGALGYCP